MNEKGHSTVYRSFSSYQVTLHNGYRTPKVVKVKRCASKVAAVRFADALEKINYPHQQGLDKFRATMAYPLDKEGNPIFRE